MRFASCRLESAITAAKAEAQHKRRIAELAGGAWDALESKRLKLSAACRLEPRTRERPLVTLFAGGRNPRSLRLEAAQAGLAAASIAEEKARADEKELLRELAIERARVL